MNKRRKLGTVENPVWRAQPTEERRNVSVRATTNRPQKLISSRLSALSPAGSATANHNGDNDGDDDDDDDNAMRANNKVFFVLSTVQPRRNEQSTGGIMKGSFMSDVGFLKKCGKIRRFLQFSKNIYEKTSMG